MWTDIMHSDRTLLYIFERGNVTLEQYCRKIILDHIRLLRDAIRPDFLFTDNNVKPLRKVQVTNIPERENINCMQWLGYSLDLNSFLQT